MDKSEVLKFLNQKMQEFSSFERLAINNNKFPRWCTTIELFLFKVFGEDSIEYQTFKESGIKRGAIEEKFKEYYKDLDRREAALASIIETIELTRYEDVAEKKDALNSPNDLFDEMQFHPRVIEASRSYFIAGNYRGAILDAFIGLIDYVKEVTGLDLDGDDLMNKVFSFDYDKDLKKITKYPIIRINELKNSTDRSEQQGFMFLYKGAAGAIRNPKAHKIIPQSNPFQTLEYVGFASLLMRILEKSTTRKIKSTKINEEIFINRCKEGGHEKAIYLYSKAKDLEESRFVNGDFINWGVSGYSYRMPWKGCINGGTIFTAFSNGKLQIWPDIILRKSSAEAGNKYLGKLRSIPRLAREFSSVSKHKYPTISTERMSEPEIDTFIEAIKELGINLDEISKEHPH